MDILNHCYDAYVCVGGVGEQELQTSSNGVERSLHMHELFKVLGECRVKKMHYLKTVT